MSSIFVYLLKIHFGTIWLAVKGAQSRVEITQFSTVLHVCELEKVRHFPYPESDKVWA